MGMWHGMGDNCCLPFSMGSIKALIEKEIPGVFVYSIEIGGNMLMDEFHGFFGNANAQVKQVCADLKNQPELANGFNALGFSQGGQFMRAYVEREHTCRGSVTSRYKRNILKTRWTKTIISSTTVSCQTST